MDSIVKASILTAVGVGLTTAAIYVYSNISENKQSSKALRRKRAIEIRNKRLNTGTEYYSSSSSSSSSPSGRDDDYEDDHSEYSSNDDDDDDDDDDDNEEDSEEYSSNSHEMSSSDSEGSDNESIQNSPRTIQDHLRILRNDDYTERMVVKKTDSVRVLLSLVAYSETLLLLSNLNTLSVIVESLNNLLSLDTISPSQNQLLYSLGLLLGNLLQYPANQKKFLELRFTSTLVNLINDQRDERSDFSLFSLQNLSLCEEGCTEIILSQGLKEIINLLESSNKKINLKAQALLVVNNLTSSSKNILDMICQNQQLSKVLESLSTSQDTLKNLAQSILQEVNNAKLLSTIENNNKNQKLLKLKNDNNNSSSSGGSELD